MNLRLIGAFPAFALAACAAVSDADTAHAPTAAPPAALLALAPPADQGALAAADQHVLVARHARKTEGCNALDCTLTDEGRAEVDRLAALLDGAAIDAAYASAACRTAATAMAAGVPVTVYRAVDQLDGGCDALELTPGDFTRALAIGRVNAGAAGWTLVADHSNFICGWAQSLAGITPSICSLAGVDESRYGDLIWLSRTRGGPWRVTVIEHAFAD